MRNNKKDVNKEVKDIAAAAKAAGLSYGKYVLQLECEKQAKNRKHGVKNET